MIYKHQECAIRVERNENSTTELGPQKELFTGLDLLFATLYYNFLRPWRQKKVIRRTQYKNLREGGGAIMQTYELLFDMIFFI